MKPEGWQIRPLRTLVVSVTAGVSVNSEGRPRRSGELGVLKTSAVTYGTFRPEENKVVVADEVARARTAVKQNTVLISRMNTVDLVAASVFVPVDHPDLVLPDRIWMIEPATGVDARWLHQCISSDSARQRLSGMATGTSGSMKNLSQEKFLGLEVLVPPLAEQRTIADVLSTAHDNIEAAQAVIDSLLQMKEQIARATFDALCAPRVRLADLGEWSSGGTPSLTREDLWRGPLPWVSPKDMKRARIADSQDHVSLDAIGKGTRAVPAGTLLMVVRGMILAHSFPVAITTSTVAFNQDIKALQVRAPDDPEYVLYWLQQQRRTVVNAATASTHGTRRVTTETLQALELPLPSPEEQRQIAAALRSIDDSVSAHREELAQLRDLRAAVADDLLTGRKRVGPGGVEAAA
jgi:type I restriction enzyme S subunit